MSFTSDEQQIINDLDGRISNIEQLIIDLKQEIEKLNGATTETGIIGLDNRLNELNSKVDLLNNDVTKINTNENNIAILDEKVDVLDGHRIGHKALIDSNRSEIINLYQKLATTEQDITNYLGPPDPPHNLILQEIEDYVVITFNLSPTIDVDEYQIWRSTDGKNYHFLNSVASIDIPEGATTLTLKDNYYDRLTILYYKIHAARNGVKSSFLAGNIEVINQVPHPTNVEVIPDDEYFIIKYDIPEDRRLDYIEIYKDAHIDQTMITESNASLIYQGTADSFIYQIPETDKDKYHQFWVYSVTRT